MNHLRIDIIIDDSNNNGFSLLLDECKPNIYSNPRLIGLMSNRFDILKWQYIESGGVYRPIVRQYSFLFKDKTTMRKLPIQGSFHRVYIGPDDGRPSLTPASLISYIHGRI